MATAVRRRSKTLYIEQRQDQALGGGNAVLLKPVTVILLYFFFFVVVVLVDRYTVATVVAIYFCSDGYQALIRIFSVICDLNVVINSKFDYSNI